MALSWSRRRKLLYTAVISVIGLVLLVVGYQVFIDRAPTCSDGLWNGDERDIDCGGACARICTQDARDPVVLWARSFSISPGSYTAAAYIQNRNQNALARGVRYSFQLFDEKNILIVERTGVVDIPPVQATPIVETGIDVGNRTVAKTYFSFSSIPVWEENTKVITPLQVGNQSLSPDGSRLSATVYNNTVEAVGRTVIIAVLFDGQGMALAASRAVISGVGKRSSQEVVFTWPNGTPGVVRAELTLLPPLP